jgi:MYXO-CTERM domain-containing protein
MKRALRSFFFSGVALAAIFGSSSPAEACGGFFCSQVQPVNQAAERIVFANNGDGTVTAVIEIMYEGPSESFSWLLPISSVPEGDQIAVASGIAFQRLQAATNPQYNLTTVVEGTCRQVTAGVGGSSFGTGGTSSGLPTGSAGGGGGPGNGVNVEASGVVGAFEWTVISLDEELEDPAEAAVTWLNDNGYDVPSGAPALVRPYLEDGLYLLALRLQKGADSGAIRPIVLTYEADRPMIPVKLTAVAANDDMGVMTWVLGEGRAVPQNYYSLELNEARINWFNASSNYNQVVIAAANDAGSGQGFVTEFSGPGSSLAQVVWSSFDEQNWQSYSTGIHQSFDEMFRTAYYQWGAWDGFWESVEQGVTLPDGVALEDFKLCPTCYSADIEVAPSTFVAALEENVIEPMRVVQKLIDAHPQVTRLYTTLSAEEMTLDPLFTFNPDLPELSNIHTAQRIIECNPDVYQFEANWRIELPSGGVIRGTPADVGTWPDAFGEMPPNRKIRREAESGDGEVYEDNTDDINAFLADYNEGIPAVATGGEGGTPGAGASGGTGNTGNTGNTDSGGATNRGGTGSSSGGNGATSSAAQGQGADAGEASDPANDADADDDGCSCRVAGSGGNSAGGIALLGFAALALARRRRR